MAAFERKKGFKAKSIRKRQCSSDDDQPEASSNISSKIDDLKIIQKTRNRPNGVEIIGLALGTKPTRSDENTDSESFNVKTGGMINVKNLSLKKVDDAYDVGIGTQFSAETNKRDEDEEMMKYIEDQLSKKKKDQNGDNEDGLEAKAYYSPEEAALLAVPAHLRASSGQRSEEMLSNQMLSGIPEVDLGIESKIKNIEATEDAKMNLIWSQKNKKEGPSQFVPSNMTVNFAQPAKFNSEEGVVARNKNRGPKRPASKDEQSKQGGKSATERATDDFHYEKFKKQFRR